jgi:uncharacterized tellurite resistance protein B-like protein
MSSDNNPDLYICALLAQIIKAREGNVKREFQAVVQVINRLREYDEKTLLEVVENGLQLDQELDFDQLLQTCKNALDDDQLREAIGLMAFVARLDGDVSPEEEKVFAMACVGLGVVINQGQVEISR